VTINEEQAFDHFMQGTNVASSRQQQGAGALARGLLPGWVNALME